MSQLSKHYNAFLKAILFLFIILFVVPVFGQKKLKEQSFKSKRIDDVFTHRAVTPQEMTERANYHPYKNREIVVAIEFQESKTLAKVQVRKFEWSQLFGSNKVKPLAYLMTKELQPNQSASLVHLSLPDGLNVFDAMNLLDGQSNVLWSSPNFYFEGDPREVVPNDPSYGSQYHHPLMQNDLAWDITYGSSDIMLGITDDGVETTHSDLSANIWINPGEIPGNGIDDDSNGYIDDVNGWDFSSGNNDPNPNSSSYDHGTHVSGICAGRTNNSIGIAGVSGHSTILPIQFYGGSGSWTAAVCNESFTYAADNGANIVNTSYNINGFVGDPVFTAGMQYMHDNGVLHFNSAGNGSELNPARQAFHQTLLVVNTDASDIKSGSSNWGSGMDISAPGSSIYSTVTSNGYGYKSGTSMAAPNAAGAAALIWSANPTWNSYQVAAQLLATADDIDPVNPSYAGLLGAGRANTYAAITTVIGAPIVKSLEGMPTEGSAVPPNAVTDFTVSFSQVMDPTTVNNITNFELSGAGPDNIFGNGDDVFYTLSTSTTYQLGTNQMTFVITGPPFITGLHRLRLISGGLANPHGTALDGDENGTGGDDFIRNFTISLAPVADFSASPTSPVPGADVIFTDLSLGTPTAWTWTITPTTFSYVNGTNANSQNPEMQFADLGYYTVTLDVSNSDGSDSETKVDYINVINCNYCASTYSNTTDDWITNVNFNTINNTSGQGGSDSYEDFTAFSTDIELSNSYGISVTMEMNGNWTEHVWVWIDWNQDCDFDDTGEAFDLGDQTNDGTVTGSITVPSGALPGLTTMRIIEQYNQNPGSCNSHPTVYGETEDYSVYVVSPGLWTGTASTDWSITTNWDDSNIPVAGTDVTIPTSPLGGIFPETNTGAGAECNNLTIESAAHLFIPSDNTLTVNGNLDNNAGINGLTVKSDANGTGSLIHNTANVDATVERYLIDGRWHFIGMPVSSSLVDVFHLPAGHSDIYLRTHIEATNSWNAYIVPLGTPLALGRGYETWVGDPAGFSQPETIEFFGTLNSGDFITGSGGFYGLQYTSGHGLNLISNPYPSALQGNINTWSKNNLANSIWTWSKDYGNYVYWGSGNDYTWGTPAFGTMTGGVIPVMQGFFVEATSSNPSLTIPQSDRIHSSQAYYKETEIPSYTLKLEVLANNYKDVVFVTFNNSATEPYDNYDVKKLFGLQEAPQLYSMISGEQLSINALPELTGYRTVQLGFECGLPGTYTFNASEIESFNGSVSIYLEDTKEGTLQNLVNNPIYPFTYNLSDEPSRFVLHFGNPNGTGDDESLSALSIYSYGDMVYIQKPTGFEGQIAIFDMLGQEIVSQKATSEGLTSIPVKSGTGYYFVKVQSGEQLVTEKVFVK